MNYFSYKWNQKKQNSEKKNCVCAKKVHALAIY